MFALKKTGCGLKMPDNARVSLKDIAGFIRFRRSTWAHGRECHTIGSEEMPVFEYKALDRSGKSKSGVIDADSAVSARQKLREQKIYPVSVDEIEEGASRSGGRSFALPSFFSRISPLEVATCTRQLSTLVGAGFPLVNAIDSLIPLARSRQFKRKLARVKDAIVEGNSFAAALSLCPETFPPFYINMVRAGETSGTLEIVLERLSEMTEKREALKQRIRTALAYPVLMALIGVAVLFFLMAYIVPSITSIFDEMNQTLPVYTRMLIAFSDVFSDYWWGGLILLAGAFFVVRRMLKKRKTRLSIHRLCLGLPLAGEIARKLAAARFSRTLGSLLENGVSMLSALDIVRNIVGNDAIAMAVESAAEEVGKGRALADALQDEGLLPGLCIQMVQVGEKSGELEKMLFKAADVFESEVESTIMTLTSLLEPILIVVMGGIVGFVVISICLPIFEMNQLIR